MHGYEKCVHDDRRAVGRGRSYHSYRDSRGEWRKGFLKSKKIVITFVILITIITGCTGLLFFLVKDIAGAINYKPDQMEEFVVEENGETALLKDSHVTNVLLIATDARSEESQARSDAMVLITLNENDNKLSMTSFQRDLYLQLAGRTESNRLNASYAYGGGGCTAKTIEQNFLIKIDGYVVINMYAAYKIVDAIDGVELFISAEEAKWINAYLNEMNLIVGDEINDSYLPEEEGIVQLNGKQAISYCRIRYLEGDDAGRAERQRKMLGAIEEKVKKLAMRPVTWKKTYQNLKGALADVETNLTVDQMVGVASKIPAFIFVNPSHCQYQQYQRGSIALQKAGWKW